MTVAVAIEGLYMLVFLFYFDVINVYWFVTLVPSAVRAIITWGYM